MRKLFHFLMALMVASPLMAGEVRKLGTEDIELGNRLSPVTSAGGVVSTPFPRYWSTDAYTDNLALYGKSLTGDNTGNISGYDNITATRFSGDGSLLTGITSASIADNAIKNADIASDAAIAGSKLEDGSVSSAKLDFAAGTVTGPATVTQDNIVTWGADNVTVKDGGIAKSSLMLFSTAKVFSFAIDNVASTDNVLLWRTPRAVTVDNAWCYASVDNVVGSLMECSTSDVTSCTVLDAWTVTNAVDPFTDASMTDGAVAAGAWIRWSTTSVGTASVNTLTCTVQYRE